MDCQRMSCKRVDLDGDYWIVDVRWNGNYLIGELERGKPLRITLIVVDKGDFNGGEGKNPYDRCDHKTIQQQHFVPFKRL